MKNFLRIIINLFKDDNLETYSDYQNVKLISRKFFDNQTVRKGYTSNIKFTIFSILALFLFFTFLSTINAQIINQFEPHFLEKLKKEIRKPNIQNLNKRGGNTRSTETYIIPVVWHVFYNSSLDVFLQKKRLN